MEDFFRFVDFSKTPALTTDEAIIFSGSLYNNQALKKECNIVEEIEDSKLIEEAYKLFKTSLFEKLDGIFNLAIYDKKSNLLFLARDKIGIKPFYFYSHNQSLIFGSNLKDFYNISTFSKKIDKEALTLYLRYGHILQSHTIFENTHKVKSGHYVCYDLNKQSFYQKKYWSLEECYLKEKLGINEDAIIENIDLLLQKSINKRLHKNQKIAVSLSGGYDSSMVTALLTKLHSKKIDTFTIGFSQDSINEAPDAKKIAQNLGTNHHEHYFSAEDALAIIPKLCEVYDEPFADYAATPTVLMNSLVKQNGFNTLFAGDGGDEVFATADDVKKFERLLKLPTPLKQSLYKILNKVEISKIPILNDYKNIPTKYYKFLKILKATDISQMVEAKNILFNEAEIEKLINNKSLSLHTTFDDINFPPFSENVDKIIGSYFKTSMTDAELVKTFGAARAQKLDISLPLLDIEVIKYLARVPQSIKIKNGEKKYILKKIAHQYMPKELLQRPKSGFSIPFSTWFKGPLKELVYEQINEKRVKDDSIFDIESVLKIRDGFYGGNDAYKYKLWSLFIFQLWYENITQVK